MSSVEPIPTKSPAPEVAICIESYATNENCLVDATNSYTYQNELGGRSLNGANISVTSNNLVVSIATGYYENRKITIFDPDNNLQKANIKDGVTLFGVAGKLTTTGSFNQCNHSYPKLSAVGSDPLGLINESNEVCATSGTFYYYDQQYGGRLENCTITTATIGEGLVNKSISGPCWYDISIGTYQIVSEPVSFPDCTINSRITKQCKAYAPNFLYALQYNGRSAACAAEAINTSSCWVGANYYIKPASLCDEVSAGTSEGDGKNDVSCQTQGPGRYVYSSPFGGRLTTATNDNIGKRWFDTSLKSDVDLNLKSANIKSSITIFGVEGNYDGTTFFWGSGGHRLTSTTANRISYKEESTILPPSPLPTPYFTVPSFTYSTEGVSGGTIDRSNWGDITCGTTGSISTRISNCLSTGTIGAAAVWNGSIKGNAGQGTWQLVTRQYCNSGVCKEVWRDASTELLWSSLVSTWSNWCYASGSSNSGQVTDNHRDPNDTICSSFLNQAVGNNNAFSACYEGGGYGSDSGFVDITGGTLPLDGKANLRSTLTRNNGRVFWRLPSIYDYSLANHNGLRFVLPDVSTDINLWTETTYSLDRTQAWVFNQKYGYRTRSVKSYSNAVRCIGR